MTIGEYVAELEKIRAEHGDLHVVGRGSSMVMGAIRRTNLGPSLAHVHIPQGHETVERVQVNEGRSYGDKEDQRGERVVWIG